MWDSTRVMTDKEKKELSELHSKTELLGQKELKLKMLSKECDMFEKDVIALREEVQQHMQNLELGEYAVREYKVKFSTSVFPKISSDIEEKRKFLAYLKEKGLYDDMVTVNAQTLRGYTNSLINQETGVPAKIPGISYFEKPKVKTTKLKKGK